MDSRPSFGAPDRSALLYVAGYGRSGSTLLDVLLARSPGVIGTGELRTLFREARSKTPCTCGCPVGECPLWGPVIDAVAAATGYTVERLADRTASGERRWAGRTARADHRLIWAAVLRALIDSTGAIAIVDSSKTPRTASRRPERLVATGEVDVRVVHLVRDPAGVLASLRSGSNRAIEVGESKRDPVALVRLTLGWTAANARAHRAVRILGGSCVRYEDLAADPTAVANSVLRAASLEPVSDAMSAADHGLSGNRARRSGFGPVRAPVSPPVDDMARPVRFVISVLRRLSSRCDAPVVVDEVAARS